MRPVVWLLPVGAALLLAAAANSPAPDPFHGRVERLFQQSVDADRDGQYERVELEPRPTSIAVVLHPSPASPPGLMSGTDGEVHVWNDDWQTSDRLSVETYWVRRDRVWVDSSRPRGFP